MSSTRVRRVRCNSCGNAVAQDELADPKAHAADRVCKNCDGGASQARSLSPPSEQPQRRMLMSTGASKHRDPLGGVVNAAETVAKGVDNAIGAVVSGVEKVAGGVVHGLEQGLSAIAHLGDDPKVKELRRNFYKPGRCKISVLGDKDYTDAAYQYATSSQSADHNSIPPTMAPLAVITPQGPASNADIYVAQVIIWAAENNFAVVCRTGGHSYAGSSSGDSGCIQLDLSEGYSEYTWNNDTGLFTTGVSLNLGEFCTALGKCDTKGAQPAGCFLPTGQCSWVHLGGHMQTGGIGQLTRAHGLLVDYVQSVTVWTCGADKKAQKVVAKAGTDLFRAVYGAGFGGCYGALVEVTFKPLRASDHPYSRAGRLTLPYKKGADKQVLRNLFELIRVWEQVPGDYDLSMTLAGSEDAYSRNLTMPSLAGFDAKYSVPGIRNILRRFYQAAGQVLIIYFQYSNLDAKPDSYDPKYWEMVMKVMRPMEARVAADPQSAALAKNGSLLLPNHSPDWITPMPDCIKLWTYQGKREFNYPYLKCCQVTNKVVNPGPFLDAITTICDDTAQPGYPMPLLFTPEFMDPLTQMIKDLFSGRPAEALFEAAKFLWEFVSKVPFEQNPDTAVAVFTQWQNFGGPASSMRTNPKRPLTSVAWRDCTMGGDLGCFYNPFNKAVDATTIAVNTHKKILNVMTDKSLFSAKDMRWIAFPHDFTNIEEQHQFYIEDPVYAFATKFKGQIDPCNVFTANPYCIGWKAPKPLLRAGALSSANAAESLYSIAASAVKLPANADDAFTELEDTKAAQRKLARKLF